MTKMPFSNETEKIILGIAIHNNNAFHNIFNILTIEDFYIEKNKILYENILETYKENNIVDIAILINKLQSKGILKKLGGFEHLSKLIEDIPSISNTEYYINILIEKTKMRKIINNNIELNEYILNNQEKNIDEFISDMNEKNANLLLNRNNDIDYNITKSLETTLQRHQKEKLKSEIGGLMTGFKIFDNYTGGLRPSTVYILGARPSVGKTALAFQIAINIAKSSNVLFFSAEMDNEELNDRYLAQLAKINSYKIMINQYSDMDYINMQNIIKETKNTIGDRLIIDDTHQIEWLELKRKVLKQYRKGLDLIIIDHLSLITLKNKDNLYNKITEISHNIKGLSKQLKIPILVLSQLNRDAVNKDRPPALQDIRDSGHIEQDADVIIIMYRDEKLKDDKEKYSSQVKIEICKNRGGTVDITRQLYFAKEYVMFQDMETHQENLKSDKLNY
jgi:replicative DNA helicase